MRPFVRTAKKKKKVPRTAFMTNRDLFYHGSEFRNVRLSLNREASF